MSRVKRSWLAQRQNWTRDQQKERILQWFKECAEKGDFGGATSHTIANALHMVSAQNIKDICDEMVLDKELDVRQIIHRIRDNGSQIYKNLYAPWCMDEWRDAWLEENEVNANAQLWLFP